MNNVCPNNKDDYGQEKKKDIENMTIHTIA